MSEETIFLEKMRCLSDILHYEILGFKPSKEFSIRDSLQDLQMEVELLHVEHERQIVITKIRDFRAKGITFTKAIPLDILYDEEDITLGRLRYECYKYEKLISRILKRRYSLEYNTHHLNHEKDS
jgi:hypothetical protein